jgi:hypothetical protein
VPWRDSNGVEKDVAEVGRMLIRKMAVERASTQNDGGMEA